MGNCIFSSATSENQELKMGFTTDVGLVSEFQGEKLCSKGGFGLSSVYSQQGKKGLNQDSVIVCHDYGIKEGIFCGVFDGHGQYGHMVSTLVRDWLPLVILNHWKGLHCPCPDQVAGDERKKPKGVMVSQRVFDEWKEPLLRAFNVMDKELKLHKSLNCSCSGTTAVTIIKQGDDLIIANLGDSRAILGTISDDGYLTVVQLTTDLKPSLPQEAARIKKSNGRIFALRDEPNVQRVWLPNDDFPGLAMARAFGDFKLKNYGIIAVPQISYHRVTARDQFLVLATDGVWDVLGNRQVAAIAWMAKSEKEAAKAVVDAAVHTWRRKYPCSKADDCSAVCIFLQERRHQFKLNKS